MKFTKLEQLPGIRNQEIMSYKERRKALGLANKDDVKALVENESGEVVFLDVRGDSEILQEPLEGDYKIVCIPCSRTDATELAIKIEEILPRKEGKSVCRV